MKFWHLNYLKIVTYCLLKIEIWLWLQRSSCSFHTPFFLEPEAAVAAISRAASFGAQHFCVCFVQSYSGTETIKLAMKSLSPHLSFRLYWLSLTFCTACGAQCARPRRRFTLASPFSFVFFCFLFFSRNKLTTTSEPEGCSLEHRFTHKWKIFSLSHFCVKYKQNTETMYHDDFKLNALVVKCMFPCVILRSSCVSG